MKKILLIGALLLGSSAALYAANDGEAVYEAHCKACHMLITPPTNSLNF